MDKERVHDPLKPLDQICEPDSRQANYLGTLEDRHFELNSINLYESVPTDVQQLFETAKNLSLYSWFVYRFHQVSELIAFSALEMALRERYLRNNITDSHQRAPALHTLLQYAKKEKWITNEGFPSLYERARHIARHKKTILKMQSHDFNATPEMPVEEPDDNEISETLEDLDLVEAIISSAHKIRNTLAHGSRMLHPNSISTLRAISEVINQVYP